MKLDDDLRKQIFVSVIPAVSRSFGLFINMFATAASHSSQTLRELLEFLTKLPTAQWTTIVAKPSNFSVQQILWATWATTPKVTSESGRGLFSPYSARRNAKSFLFEPTENPGFMILGFMIFGPQIPVLLDVWWSSIFVCQSAWLTRP